MLVSALALALAALDEEATVAMTDCGTGLCACVAVTARNCGLLLL